MISKQFNPHDIKVGDLVTGYHKGFHLVTKIEERWYKQNSRYECSEKESTEFPVEGSPLIYYKKQFSDDGVPTKSNKQQCCDMAFCIPAKIAIKERIKKLHETITNLNLI